MANPAQIDDFLRRLAAQSGSMPAAPVRQLELPLPNTIGVESPADYLRRMQAVHGVDDSYGPAARSAVNNSPDIPPLAAAAAPDMSLGSPLWHQMDKGARAHDNLVKGRTANLRNQNPDLVRIAGDNIREGQALSARMATRNADQQALLLDGAVAAGMGGAAAIAATRPMPSPAPAVAAEGRPAPAQASTADLAAESRPVPSVPATATDGQQLTEDEFTETFKQQSQAREDKRAARGAGGYADPSDKAKAILDDLNARRRKAGGEVPEARQMEAEANRLLAESNQMRNAPGYKPKNASNPREQAQVLLQQLNADRMEAGGEVPHSREVLQEVRRLQLLGDQQRWGG
jgi:hypothetical protein